MLKYTPDELQGNNNITVIECVVQRQPCLDKPSKQAVKIDRLRTIAE